MTTRKQELINMLPLPLPDPSIASPLFTGRLEYEETMEHKSIGGNLLRLHYSVSAAPSMSDIDAQVGLRNDDIESIEQRIMCGDIWAWCNITVQVMASGSGVRGEQYDELIGEAVQENCTYYSLQDFLHSSHAYTWLKVAALKDLSRKIEECNRAAKAKTMLFLVNAEVDGKVKEN